MFFSAVQEDLVSLVFQSTIFLHLTDLAVIQAFSPFLLVNFVLAIENKVEHVCIDVK